MNRNHSDREWNCYDFFLAVIHVIEYTHANDKIRTRIRTCICTHQYKTGTHPATQRWAKYLLFITTQSSLLQKDQIKKKTWVFRSFAVTVWSRICSSKTSCKDARCTEAYVAQGWGLPLFNMRATQRAALSTEEHICICIYIQICIYIYINIQLQDIEKERTYLHTQKNIKTCVAVIGGGHHLVSSFTKRPPCARSFKVSQPWLGSLADTGISTTQSSLIDSDSVLQEDQTKTWVFRILA